MYRFKYTGQLTRKISLGDKVHFLDQGDELSIDDGSVVAKLNSDKFFLLLPGAEPAAVKETVEDAEPVKKSRVLKVLETAADFADDGKLNKSVKLTKTQPKTSKKRRRKR